MLQKKSNLNLAQWGLSILSSHWEYSIILSLIIFFWDQILPMRSRLRLDSVQYFLSIKISQKGSELSDLDLTCRLTNSNFDLDSWIV